MFLPNKYDIASYFFIGNTRIINYWLKTKTKNNNRNAFEIVAEQIIPMIPGIVKFLHVLFYKVYFNTLFNRSCT